MYTRTSLLFSVALAATLLVGCVDAPDAAIEEGALPGRQLPPPISYAMEPLPAVDAGALQLGRLIGVKTGLACPVIGPDWDGAQLFDAGSPGLQDFCRYDWVGAGLLTPAALAAAMNTPGVTLYPDRPVVAPMAPAVQKIWESSANTVTRGQANEILTMTGTPPKKVNVVVVDNMPTMPHSAAPWDNFLGGHAQLLANAARDLACDSMGRCAIDVSTGHAMSLTYPITGMPLVETETNLGAFGSIASLAVAIREEVSAWKEAGVYDHLVLNLSLAWHPAYGGLDNPAERPDTAAVYAALVDAQCRGALVIAATGNTSGGSQLTDGPMLPAAWAIHRPDPAACEAMIDDEGVAPYQPLLYPASGVDSRGDDIANSRPDSRSSWVAYANAFTLTSPSSPPEARTGTSMAAIVVSTAAATVLAWRPDLTPHTAMADLHGWGTLIDDAAGWWVDGDLPPDARQIKICTSLKEACLDAPGTLGCHPGHVPSCATTTQHLSANSIQRALWQASATPMIYVPAPVPDGGVCPGTIFRHSTAPDPELGCPDVQLYDDGVVSAFTDPQPEDGHCSGCTIEIGNSVVDLESAVPFNQHTNKMIRVTRFDDTSTIYQLPTMGAQTKVKHTFPANTFLNVKTATWMSTINGVTRANAMTVLP